MSTIAPEVELDSADPKARLPATKRETEPPGVVVEPATGNTPELVFTNPAEMTEEQIVEELKALSELSPFATPDAILRVEGHPKARVPAWVSASQVPWYRGRGYRFCDCKNVTLFAEDPDHGIGEGITHRRQVGTLYLMCVDAQRHAYHERHRMLRLARLEGTFKNRIAAANEALLKMYAKKGRKRPYIVIDEDGVDDEP